MTYVFILATILLGFFTVMLTVGSIALIVFVALPITGILADMGFLKHFRPRTKEWSLVFNAYFLVPLTGYSLMFIAVTIGFYYFFANYLFYLAIGYALGVLMIIFNYFVRGLYSVNRDSFENWYLNDHRKALDYDKLRRDGLDDEKKLFDFVSTILSTKNR